MSGNSERIEVEDPTIVAMCPECDTAQRVWLSEIDKYSRSTLVRCVECDEYFIEYFISTNWRDRKNGKESTVPMWEASRRS